MPRWVRSQGSRVTNPNNRMNEPIEFRAEQYVEHLNFERGLSPLTVSAYTRELQRFITFAVLRVGEFQHDHDLKVTSQIDDVTRNQLKSQHGC